MVAWQCRPARSPRPRSTQGNQEGVVIAGSSLDPKTYRSFSALFCRLERKRKVSIEKRKLNMWFVNERLIRQCAYRGAMITSAKPTSRYLSACPDLDYFRIA